ncbi:hypothetical protein BIW11_05260 [Tropilaelaps mercedesae]|uniref:Uncharacterized protein n=1 Tax=Tropilaelaps mercedesae TaxID=418985 RepID=A0A1V9Y314_9ACAR|nr:hypothetical protein BIW11_05260 [Tropilaelaps mercedesae]
MAASPLKLVTVAGTDLSVHAHPLNTFNNSSNTSTNRSSRTNRNHYKPLIQLSNHLHHHRRQQQQKDDLPVWQSVQPQTSPPASPQHQQQNEQHHQEQQQQQQETSNTPASHHVTFNLQPQTRSGSPLLPNGGITDGSLLIANPMTMMTRPGLLTAARRKMSVMHTDPLFVVQENNLTTGTGFNNHLNVNHCHRRLSVGVQDGRSAETMTTFSGTFDLSRCNKMISNDGSVVCSVVSSSSTPYDPGDTRDKKEMLEEVNLSKPSTIYGAIAAEIGVLIQKKKEKDKERESPRRLSPKKSLQLSPKDLEEHISKIISQNAAIVETDPLYRKTSRDSKTSTRRFSSFDLGRSKLQTALLAGANGCNPRRVSSVEVPIWPQEHRELREWREQNPDSSSSSSSSSGSIIKDLLLKSRAPFPPPPLPTADTSEGYPCSECQVTFSSQEQLNLYPDCSGGAVAVKRMLGTVCSISSVSSITIQRTEEHRDDRHVSVIKRSDVQPLKKRKFSEPAYLHSTNPPSSILPFDTPTSGVGLLRAPQSSTQLFVPVIVTTPASPENREITEVKHALLTAADGPSKVATSMADFVTVSSSESPWRTPATRVNPTDSTIAISTSAVISTSAIVNQTSITITVTTTGYSDLSMTCTPSTSNSACAVIKPARPTSLELSARPSVLIGSNLISPDTPRPQKTFRQTFIDGHAYTTLGLKVSTRSTYCCIYRPQPIFVLQETDPRLSMYSNWVMYPFTDEHKLGAYEHLSPPAHSTGQR